MDFPSGVSRPKKIHFSTAAMRHFIGRMAMIAGL
jgi:hypothetical protein